MIRLSTPLALALILGATAAFGQTQPSQIPPMQGEPGAKRPATAPQGNPGAAKQLQPDGDEIGWGQSKTDKESKAEASRNEMTGQAPASAPAQPK